MEENRYILTVLEEPQTLTAALKRLVRKLHDDGGRIKFPVPDAVDEITLKRHDPTIDPKDLIELVDQVFESFKVRRLTLT